MNSASKKPALLTALSVGALWGIFESTAGYLLHLLPVSVGFLVWYPAAFYFMTRAYRVSGKPNAVLLTAFVAAAVKLLNLLLPGSADKVINPAVSIIFEGLAVYAAVRIYASLRPGMQKKSLATAALSLGTNSIWRMLFIAYLAFFVPQWMRETSVLQSADKLLRFFIIDNLASSALVWMGFEAFRRSRRYPPQPSAANIPSNIDGASSLIWLMPANIGLQLFLK